MPVQNWSPFIYFALLHQYFVDLWLESYVLWKPVVLKAKQSKYSVYQHPHGSLGYTKVLRQPESRQGPSTHAEFKRLGEGGKRITPNNRAVGGRVFAQSAWEKPVPVLGCSTDIEMRNECNLSGLKLYYQSLKIALQEQRLCLVRTMRKNVHRTRWKSYF